MRDFGSGIRVPAAVFWYNAHNSYMFERYTWLAHATRQCLRSEGAGRDELEFENGRNSFDCGLDSTQLLFLDYVGSIANLLLAHGPAAWDIGFANIRRCRGS